MATSSLTSFLKSKTFWQDFASDLHIFDHDFCRTNNSLDLVLCNKLKQDCQNLIKKEGYFQAAQYFSNEEANRLGNLVKQLSAANILPVFSYIYDETWLMMLKAKPIIESVLGEGYKLRPCIWSWHLDPSKEDGGWKPHRDGVKNSINSDGSPNLLTVWIALSEANPLNGCMYLVPMDRSAKPHEIDDPTNIYFDFQSVRALPARPGDLLMWNHWVIHWGSKSSKRASEPRISMAFELEKADSNINEMPLISATQLPSFDARLKLIAYQIYQYTHMYKFSEPFIQFAREVLEA
jgi:hypothetical protein